jgi:hypothetical protein
MPLLDCRPPYAYRPNFTENGQCTAPGFIEKRARLFAGGTFFRSKNAGEGMNLIAVEYTQPTTTVVLNIYDDGALVETWDSGVTPETPPVGSPSPDCAGTVAAALRVIVNANSNYIEMPSVDYGGVSFALQPIFLASNPPSSTPPGDDCDNLFGPTTLADGEGPPTDDTGLASIRTGPDRSMVILRETEIVNNNASDQGLLVTPPQDQKVRQWDGFNWIQYVPNADCTPVIP